ncbi:MCE family protein [Rhodococcus sp. HNM0563]|uniref:MCE family protein n=1 Tax=unclassified Rhodococcus (in: high G+C Gram-positive bacteria) TaxID=192944 RepID=UPI001469A83C|nr:MULTISPECIES: MCE family protein [unclassified Rhodococcus (in: high G+C Gram-positive bacteria)]MCK0089219.1 MCE family protein [Rhodococcus sp. F64268]NLU62761.1 MCE family protein [Rhodococcus sp. HNM0563]
MRESTVKFSIFALVMVLVFAGLAVVFSQARFTGTEGYHATFTDVSGLETGDKVRIAGVQVGSVTGVDIGDGNHAEVDFDVDSHQTLFASTRATVRYENLVGDRYLELLEGPGSIDILGAGGSIPVEQTEPALDLDLLLGGFKPLLKGLDSKQVNDLSGALLQVFQGQGDALVSLLGSTNSFTNSIADRDQLIGDVIDNLNGVLGTIDDHDREFTETIDRLHTLVGGLADDKDPIGAAIPQIAAGTADLASLLQNTRPDLQSVIAQTNRTMTQLDLGEDDINATLERLPSDYKKLIRVGAYGNFFQFFLCANTFKLSGPDGTTIRYTTAAQTTGRCAKLE